MNRSGVVLVLLGMLGAAGQCGAQSAAVHDYSIAGQPLSQAIIDFSRQSNITVTVQSQLLEGKAAPEVKGSLGPMQALEKLLKGSGLKATWTASGGIAIASKMGQREAEATSAGQAMRLAQGGESTPQAEETPESHDTGAVTDFPRDTDQDDRKGIPEIMVTGSRSLNIDIERSENAAQPYLIFDRQTIERSGARNLEDFLQQRVSASTTFGSSSQSDTNGSSASEISLRGLGADETLILIDGRRAAGFVNNDSSSHQPDINGISLMAVERIEVLPTTASGIYGGSATGGVINIVLRRDYSGAEAHMTYGNSFDSDVAARRVDLSGGFNLEGGRTNILLAGSYSNANNLLVRERDVERRRRALVMKNNPDSIVAGFLPILGATTNIQSVSGGDLTLSGSGIELGKPIAYVPSGYAGVSADDGAAFLETAGRYNLELADTAQFGGGGQALLNAPTVKSIISTIRREMTPRLDTFLEFFVSENTGAFRTSNASSTFYLAPGDPGNPFNEDIFATTPAFGADGMGRTSLKNYRAVAGLIFKLPRDWRLAVDYTWNRTRFSSEAPGFLDINAANADVSSGVLDIFRDTNESPLDFSPYVLPESAQGPAKSALSDFAFRLSGKLPWALPGGAPTLSAMLETRKEILGDFFFVTQYSAFDIARRLTPERSQAVASVYLESVLPVVTSVNSRRGLELLELQLAGRHDEYRTRATNSVMADESGAPLEPVLYATNRIRSTDPTFGLRYQPLAGVMMRASYGTGFLPPAVNQLISNGPTPFAPSSLTDPQRGGESLRSLLYTSSGNPGLNPEESRSHSAGLVLTPPQTPGMRFSVDWTRIEKSGAIQTIGALNQSGLESMLKFLPQRVTRNADPSTFGIYGVGPIVAIDDTLVNIARSETEALDFSFDYERVIRFGTLTFSSRATRMLHDKTTLTPEALPTENVDFFGDLKWRGNGTMTWDYAGWTAAWTLRYFASACIDLGCPFNADQAARRVPSQTYHDVFVSHRFVAGDLEVQFGVNNVFNKEPPIYIYGGYSLFGDPRLANYYLSLRKEFSGKGR